MCVNLQKTAQWIKGFAALTIAAIRIAFVPIAVLPIAFVPIGSATAQPADDPYTTGLAGSVAARTGSGWSALTNPAMLAGTGAQRTGLDISSAPSRAGIAGYSDGIALLTWRADSTAHAGLSADGWGAGGYRELGVGLLLAGRFAGSYDAGARVSVRNVAIERYGSAFTATIDAGIGVRLDERLAFGASFTNITRSRLAGLAQPQRLSLGCCYEIGSTTLSLDIAHELQRSSGIAAGIEFRASDHVALRSGIGTGPDRIAIGIGLETSGWHADYGARFAQPLGLSHCIGVGLRW